MTLNEDIVRRVYRAAEENVETFIGLFAENGYLYDVSAGKKYYGREVGDLVRNVNVPFPDMHRQLQNVHASGDVVVVELSLNGTHAGPLETPDGTLPATGKKVQVPCCDIWTLKDGRIRSFHCYTATAILIAQLRSSS